MNRPPERLSRPTAVIASSDGVLVYSGRMAEPICARLVTAGAKPNLRARAGGARLPRPQVLDAGVLQLLQVLAERLRVIPHAHYRAELHRLSSRLTAALS